MLRRINILQAIKQELVQTFKYLITQKHLCKITIKELITKLDRTSLSSCVTCSANCFVRCCQNWLANTRAIYPAVICCWPIRAELAVIPYQKSKFIKVFTKAPWCRKTNCIRGRCYRNTKLHTCSIVVAGNSDSDRNCKRLRSIEARIHQSN